MSDDDADINVFDRYGIDPLGGMKAITERMRALIAQAEDEDERRALRAAWETLTLHPARRLEAALGAHPAAGPALDPPPPPRPLPLDVDATPALYDLVLRPAPSLRLERPSEVLPETHPEDDPLL